MTVSLAKVGQPYTPPPTCDCRTAKKAPCGFYLSLDAEDELRWNRFLRGFRVLHELPRQYILMGEDQVVFPGDHISFMVIPPDYYYGPITAARGLTVHEAMRLANHLNTNGF